MKIEHRNGALHQQILLSWKNKNKKDEKGENFKAENGMFM